MKAKLYCTQSVSLRGDQIYLLPTTSSSESESENPSSDDDDGNDVYDVAWQATDDNVEDLIHRAVVVTTPSSKHKGRTAYVKSITESKTQYRLEFTDGGNVGTANVGVRGVQPVNMDAGSFGEKDEDEEDDTSRKRRWGWGSGGRGR
jgi:hypothetical protein